jgi:hypothetical protein
MRRMAAGRTEARAESQIRDAAVLVVLQHGTGQMQPSMTRLVTLAKTIRAVRMGSPRRWPNTMMLNERLSGRVFAAVHRRQTVRLQVGPEWCLLNTAQFAHDTSCRPVTADERRALRFIVSWSSASI